MSEVKRYTGDLLYGEPVRGDGGVFVLASDYDAAQSELAALREELAEARSTIQGLHEAGEFLDKVNQGVEDDLRNILSEAQQRNAELVEMLRGASSYTRHPDYDWDLGFIKEVYAAIKPTESGASE